MKKPIIIGIGILILLLTGISLFNGGLTGNATVESVSLGYCPTMKQIAEKIANDDENIVLVEQGSSAQALQDLNNQKIDVVLIGRKAEQNEIQSVNERMLGQGHTLVTSSKKFIQESELANIKVYTAVEENIAKKMLPNTEIIFFSTAQEAINKGLHEAVLIDWKDYKDEFELLVILKGIEKSEKFRIPVLYSKNYDLETINVQGGY